MSYKRSKINRKKSKKMFTNGASKTHKKNLTNTNPMRGGIRL